MALNSIEVGWASQVSNCHCKNRIQFFVGVGTCMLLLGMDRSSCCVALAGAAINEHETINACLFAVCIAPAKRA